jgi:outer membrane murein-binding lipoprotein Lpp
MTQTEIKAKIADWESRLKNPSVASVPSAVAKINSIIDDLKSKLEAEKPKEKAPKKEKAESKKELTKDKLKEIRDEYDENEDNNAHSENTVLLAKYFGTKEELEKANDILEKHNELGSIPEKLNNERYELSEKLYKKFVELEGKGKKAKADKKEFEPKFKVGDYVSMFKDESNLEVVKVYEWSDKKATYDLKSKDGKINRGNISETKLTKAEEKSEPKESKKSDYDCDDLIKEAKERHAKAKKAAEVRAEAPKKTEATKDKEKIEKVYDNVEKHIEKNKLSKAQLEKLIAETKDLLKLLEKALKNL